VVDPGTPVMRMIAERMPATIKLNVLSVLLVYASAIPIGIYAAVRHRALTERAVTVLLFVLYSLPSFWVGLLLLMFFCSDRFLRWFPVAGLSPSADLTWGLSYWQILGMTAKHYVLPVLCLTYGGLAGLSRYARSGMLEVIRQDYVRTARAKGVPEWRVILVHTFRNGLMPLVTLFADLLPGLVAGSIIVEYIFSIYGMGSLSILALTSRDYPLMMALFSMGAFLTLLGILLSDLCYAVVDPRITFE
jgi:peptide/nickel transport system permease protein